MCDFGLEKGLYIKYKMFFDEKDATLKPLCDAIYNTGHGMFINNRKYKLYISLSKDTKKDVGVTKPRMIYVFGMDYNDITNVIPKKLLHEYMRMYVNINGI